MKQIYKIVITLLLLVSCNLFVSLEGVRLLKSDDDDNECKAWLVQSIPTAMPELPLVPGVLATGNFLYMLMVFFNNICNVELYGFIKLF